MGSGLQSIKEPSRKTTLAPKTVSKVNKSNDDLIESESEDGED
jgi:hypothetical protein